MFLQLVIRMISHLVLEKGSPGPLESAQSVLRSGSYWAGFRVWSLGFGSLF